MQLQHYASAKFRAPISLCLVAIVAACWPPAPLATQEPVLLGRVEPAFAQPTAVGRAIATLQVFDGRLYVGYGDFTADTGPIAITPVDLSTGRIGGSLLSFATEAVYGFRQIGDQLFAADIDPRGTRQGGFARGVNRDGAHVWTDHKVVAALHVFDVATMDGADLWLFGSAGNDAVAWRSLDHGVTWTTALSVRPWFVGGFARLYSGAVIEGKLFTQVVETPGGPVSTGMVFDGTQWTTGPGWFPSYARHEDTFPWRPHAVGRQVVYMDQHSGASHRVVRLYRFDGREAHLTFGPTDRHATPDPQDAVVDLTAAAATAFVLNRRQEVWSSTDLVDWRRRATFKGPDGDRATSIAVSGNSVYVGTSASNIYRMALAR